MLVPSPTYIQEIMTRTYQSAVLGGLRTESSVPVICVQSAPLTVLTQLERHPVASTSQEIRRLLLSIISIFPNRVILSFRTHARALVMRACRRCVFVALDLKTATEEVRLARLICAPLNRK